jgi:NTE family protein
LTAEGADEYRLRPVAPPEARRTWAARRIGVCLSGGGFRAAFYALGALRYLAEAGLLRRVDVISAVSGGSIAAGMVIDRWNQFLASGATEAAFLETIDAPFRVAITRHNLRNRWLLRSLVRSLWFRSPGRGVALGRTLAKHLYNHDSIAEIPARPQVIFTSTDLATGRAFRIAHDFVGNYDYKYLAPTPSSIGLGTAVAASAAFPMALSVIWLPAPNLPEGDPPTTLSLHDGGVYDNLGLEWFQGWGSGRPDSALKPDFLIVVNASGPPKRADRVFGAARALKRDMSIQYQQTLALRVRWLVSDWLKESGGGAYIGIAGDPRTYRYEREGGETKRLKIDPALYAGALPSALVEPLAFLRTDLDCFSREEAELLSYHGYWSLHARLGMYVPELTLPAPSWHEERLAQMPATKVQELVARLEKGAKFQPWRWSRLIN